LIIGGAGVGKTTVLKTLYQVYDAAGVNIYQMTLAGKAAKRMSEITKRPASTIASFLLRIGALNLSKAHVIVIDEASMLDVVTMFRLCESLPLNSRILLTGDSNQLMPVGPGLVLQELAKFKAIPHVELTVVKRYGGLLSKVAYDTRSGIWPELPKYPNQIISFLPCEYRDITSLVVEEYHKEPSRSQILCSRKVGPDGTSVINLDCQRRYTRKGKDLLRWNKEFGQYESTGFYLNDIVICTRNYWDLGIQNGSLGRLVSIDNELPKNGQNQVNGGILGVIEWDDGITRPVHEDHLSDIQLGYAITVHKAQGSQWPIVIIPLTSNRLLDRTLIYTAITRACTKVILIGDPEAARVAVEGLPKSNYRQTGLAVWLETFLVN